MTVFFKLRATVTTDARSRLATDLDSLKKVSFVMDFLSMKEYK